VNRILIVGDHDESQTRARRLLSEYSTVIEVDSESADAEIRAHPPQILIFFWPESGGAELLRSFIAADKTGGMYVITASADHQPMRSVASAFAAGSHDVMSGSYCALELLARVDVRRRLRRWISSSAKEPTSTRSVVDALRAWRGLGDVVAEDLETMLNRSLTVEEGWPPFGESIQLATISMALPSEHVELCLSLVADTPTRRWLGETLLGDADASEEAIDDLMREMVNVAGGALKLAVIAEGPTLTTGIPVDGRSLPGRDSGAKCWTIPLDVGVSIAIIGEVRRRANRRIPAIRLSEGMVVVNDVRNVGGVLLVPSGTRLTSTTAHRLSSLLDLTLVEVSA
jgi:CheY-like chemotaxis protein